MKFDGIFCLLLLWNWKQTFLLLTTLYERQKAAIITWPFNPSLQDDRLLHQYMSSLVAWILYCVLKWKCVLIATFESMDNLKHTDLNTHLKE